MIPGHDIPIFKNVKLYTSMHVLCLAKEINMFKPISDKTLSILH